ncbi:anaphase-promoting complex subunit 2-like [Actinia tenebrosa]|uniref:Anaphase-promoting complex subunit 2 n=1 Tax=Actinia tenebrosa TaxID=6105 RepID=A0A6P8HT33_ACTTE|nr:anaphase-promoting complex subunit 2-like [Actinia tenebrosa]
MAEVNVYQSSWKEPFPSSILDYQNLSQLIGTWNNDDPLRKAERVKRLLEFFLEIVQYDLTTKITPEFWRQNNSDEDEMDDKDKKHPKLYSAVNYLYKSLSIYQPSLNLLYGLTKPLDIRDAKESFQSLIRVIVFGNIPEMFNKTVEEFYSQAFKAYQVTNKPQDQEADISVDDDESNEDISLECTGCEQEKDSCICQTIVEQFTQFNNWLCSMGLLHKVAGAAYVSVIHNTIKDRIEQKCKGEFETSFLEVLTDWMETELFRWLSSIIHNQDKSEHSNLMSLDSWKPRLKYFMYKTFADLRIGELFNIIVEFPESMPAIQDLKECLDLTDQRSQLVNSLRSVFEKRLLHPGANTSVILTQYVSAIKALHVLDPTSVILENVCEPVKQYLRTREDTVRCIVTSLTDDSSTELAEELMHGEPHPIDDPGASESEEETEDWMPDPVDAPPARSSRAGRTPDIISMLVNIYGSKDLFVSEYRTLLADRILSTFNYDTDKELRYLELLKLRFGESHLHFCEIMLKDVADSRRINTHIHTHKERAGDQANDIDMNAMILSAVFWPSFREEKLKVPDVVKESMDQYRTGYEALKGMRTLQWKSHLGLVEVELELEDRTLNLTVSPIHATAIWHFQEKDRWQIEELCSVMQVTPGTLRKRLAFWVNQGVLKEESHDTFVVVEKQKGLNKVNNEMVMDAELESVTASAEHQREEELQVFWSYIVGMLTNLESLPLERIHSMLRMFAMQGPSSTQCSVEDLRRFLNRKVREQELQFVNGFYRLPKSGR